MRQQCGFAFVAVLIWGTVLGVGILKPMSVHADTDIIPSVTVRERYDTNVYFAPPERLPPGTRLNDFVSTVGAGAQVLHKSREIEGSLTGQVDGNVYAYNRELNNLTVRATGDANLNNWVNQYVRGAKLGITERLRYTPEAPGLLTGIEASPVEGENAFESGVQGFRSSTFVNTTSLDGSYSVAKDLALQGRYAFFTRQQESVAATTGATFFNTVVHAWSIGPEFQFTPTDGVSLSYQPALITQTQSQASASPKIETYPHTLTTEYRKVMPNWRLGMGGGATLVQPANEVFPTGFINFSTNPERLVTFDLDFSRLVKPSTFQVSGALVSNIGRAQVIYRLSERLNLRGSVSYAMNESVPKGFAEYNNFSLSTGLNYKLTRTIGVDLSYNYYDYKTETETLDYRVLRNVWALMLTAEWR